MKVILYPGSTLTVSAPSLIDITALSDVQTIGAPTPVPTPTTTPIATPSEARLLSPDTPVTVTVSPPPK